MPAKMKTIDGVKNVSIVIGVKFVVVASDELAEKGKMCKYFRLIAFEAADCTYDTVGYRTIAIELFRSLCNTMDLALRHQHFGNNFRHSALAEIHSVVECVSVVFVNPIFGMGCLFSSCSLVQRSIDRFPSDSRLNRKV